MAELWDGPKPPSDYSGQLRTNFNMHLNGAFLHHRRNAAVGIQPATYATADACLQPQRRSPRGVAAAQDALRVKFASFGVLELESLIAI